MPLSRFHPLIVEWFRSNVGTPTDLQVQAWSAIQSGADVLIAAPTGSGKTFGAFLSCIDHIFKQECEMALYLLRNPDPGFTPGSTPGFGPDSESNSVAVSSNKSIEPLDFTILAS